MLWWLLKSGFYLIVETLSMNAVDVGPWPRRPPMPRRQHLPPYDKHHTPSDPEIATKKSQSALRNLGNTRSKRREQP